MILSPTSFSFLCLFSTIYLCSIIFQLSFQGITMMLIPIFFLSKKYILKAHHVKLQFFQVQIPRLFSAVLFAIGDCYMYKVSIKLYGKLSSDWVAVCLCTPWFLSYCAPRSLTSCAEMVLFSISLYYYPWNQKKGNFFFFFYSD